MQTTLENVINEAKNLSHDELKKLKETIDSILETEEKTKSTMTEEEFAQYLFEKGIIGKPPPPITDFSRYDDYEPVEISGEPISKTIIRERR